jgi:serine/threonine protein kinase
MGCGASSDSVDNVTIPGKDLYQRKELIGVGHHGRVYRCLYNLDSKEYAIKVLSQLHNQSDKIVSN